MALKIDSNQVALAHNLKTYQDMRKLSKPRNEAAIASTSPDFSGDAVIVSISEEARIKAKLMEKSKESDSAE